MRIFAVAGEPSGDLRAAEVVSHLVCTHGASVAGMGGRCMASAGARIIHDIAGSAVMGFGEVLGSLARLARMEKALRAACRAFRPDAVLLVDYPGFNLRFAAWASRAGYRVVYYVSPQLWAWGGWRLSKVARHVDLMITLFSFEAEFYAARGVRTFWSGHPLVDAVKDPSPGGSRLALLPGSRAQEVSRLLPVMLSCAASLFDRGLIDGADIAVSRALDRRLYSAAESKTFARLVDGTGPALENAAAALVCSGTATLETALRMVPFVVMYRTSPATYAAARLLVRGVDGICLASIVAGRSVAPELLQGRATPSNAEAEIARLLPGGPARSAALEAMGLVRCALGPPGAASRAASRIALELGGRVDPCLI